MLSSKDWLQSVRLMHTDLMDLNLTRCWAAGQERTRTTASTQTVDRRAMQMPEIIHIALS